MKYLILGGSGHIGRSLLSYFRQKKELVIGTSRKKLENNLIIFNPFKDNWNTLGTFDVLINCIGIIKESGDYSFEKVHVDLVNRILENRKSLGDPVIIHLSALGADKSHPIKFLRTKGIADEILMKEKDVHIVRPSIVCFPETMLLKKLKFLQRTVSLTRNYLLLPKGFLQHKIQPILMDDLKEIIVNLTKKKIDHSLINITGREEITYGKLIGFVADNIRIIEVNRRLSDLFVKSMIAPLFPSLFNYEQYQLLFYDNIANYSYAEEILGRKFLSAEKFWQNNLK